MNVMRSCRFFIGFGLLLWSICLSAAELGVPGEYQNIQSAIDSAADGDTILIADGTYSGVGNIGIHWDATARHLVIMSENGREHCIIDCLQEDRAFLLNQGQDRRDVIQGLSMTNGKVNGAGGAINILSASPTIRDCLLANNHATGYHDNSYSGGGGAIVIQYESDPLIQGNIIRNNVADNLGGGLLFAEHTSGVLENNVIEGNMALDHWGGGIALWNSASPFIIGNLIIHNSCSGFNGGRGGGIYYGNSESVLVNNTIAFNATTGDEYGDGYGGGISIDRWGSPVIINCIIWYNRSGASSMNIYFDPQEWLDISYCNVEYDLGHIFDLEPHTNMDVPPAFADTASGNFQLNWNSPCINKGDADTTGMYLPSLDPAGNLRIYEDRVDIGAYEYNRPSSREPLSPAEDFQLYPNPSEGSFFINYGGGSVLEAPVLRICDMRGALIREEYLDLNQVQVPVNISGQAHGVYILTLHSQGKVLYRQKLVIK